MAEVGHYVVWNVDVESSALMARALEAVAGSELPFFSEAEKDRLKGLIAVARRAIAAVLA